MKIVLTGASGFLGQELVPLLKASGSELLLVGRDPARLAGLFPNQKTCGYDELGTKARQYDILIHLAVVNNNVSGPMDLFREVNVDTTLKLQEIAQAAQIGRFVNISSIHALDASNSSPYAVTKREAARLLKDKGGNALTLYLPSVHGSKTSGRLAILNSLPGGVARTLLTVLSAFKPTLKVAKLARYLLDRSLSEAEQEVVLSDGQSDNPVFLASKRLIDIGFALFVILFLWWLMLITWIVIRLESHGPGIFAQKRIGRQGQEFVCYKFRTMKSGTVQAATNEVSAAAVTKAGRVLRKTKIDELPQVWNILRNEISLVGPRPCLPNQTELIARRMERGVLELKPGITGLAQVNGIDMSIPDRLARWDQRYGALQSLMLDLKIIVSTARGRGQGDKVAK